MADTTKQIVTNPNKAIIASGGTLIITDTSAHTFTSSGYGMVIECVSDATVSACTGFDENGDALNFKTSSDFNWVNLKAGYSYYCGENKYINSITLSGGSVNVHKYKV